MRFLLSFASKSLFKACLQKRNAHLFSLFVKIFPLFLTLQGCSSSTKALFPGNPFENPFNTQETSAPQRVTIRPAGKKLLKRAPYPKKSARAFLRKTSPARATQRPVQKTYVQKAQTPVTRTAKQQPPASQTIPSPSAPPPTLTPQYRVDPFLSPPKAAVRQRVSPEKQSKTSQKTLSKPPEANAPSSRKPQVSSRELNFRWPVRGRVILAYGAKNPQGKKNNGINIAVPEGTRVKAAANGQVAYIGDEANNYGKIVLIKHPNGYISAYAHNREIIVTQGETIKRGQVIAYAGQTGRVARPQVHFEIRKGLLPVDPITYLQ